MNGFTKSMIGVALIFALSISTLVFWPFESARIPRDAAVQKAFILAKPDLIQLAKMLSNEPNDIVGVTDEEVILKGASLWVSPEEAKMTDEHFAEYQRMMKKADVTRVWRQNNQFYFYYRGWGYAASGWRLQFLFSHIIPNPMVESLNSLPPPTADRNPVYRSLGNDWYVVIIY